MAIEHPFDIPADPPEILDMTGPAFEPRQTWPADHKGERIPDTLKDLRVPIAELVHYDGNPNVGSLPEIMDSLRANGQYRPVVVRTGTMEILAGNHTVKAARQMGWENVAATFVTCTDDQAARIVLVDNRTNDLSTYDNEALTAMLEDLPDLIGTGWDQESVDNLVFGLEQEPAEAPDSADEVPAPRDPIARPGDIFQLGEHRLAVGHAEDAALVDKLMGDERADVLWTDPPYGVEYQTDLTPAQAKAQRRRTDGLTVQNDGVEGLEAMLLAAFGQAIRVLKPGAAAYCAAPQGPQVAVFQKCFVDSGFRWRQNLVWIKHSLVLGHSDYHYKHEPIMEGSKPDPDSKENEPLLYGFAPGGEGRLGRGGARWYGPNNGTTVFEVDKPAASEDHPTMKPVKLVLAMLANSLRPGGIVLDPFAGSGTTLIAAQYHGARARVIELDPRYADVICARFQKETGDMPTRDGEELDFIREDG